MLGDKYCFIVAKQVLVFLGQDKGFFILSLKPRKLTYIWRRKKGWSRNVIAFRYKASTGIELKSYNWNNRVKKLSKKKKQKDDDYLEKLKSWKQRPKKVWHLRITKARTEKLTVNAGKSSIPV